MDKLKYCLLTNDVETTSIWLNSLNDNTGLKVFKEGMPILLNIYAKNNIKSTFFFTSYIAKLYPDIVKMILNDGHKVGSHGKSHLPKYGFDIMPFKMQKNHLEYSKKLLEDISGQEVISFRAPALRVNNNTVRALIETGYKIDSSIASQRFDFFLSFGSKNKLKWITSTRLPYRVDENNIFKKGNSTLIEIPLSAFFFPYVGTFMRIFPWLSSITRYIIHLENNMNKKPVVFDIHPNEFIDESGEKREIQNRSNNIITYLLKDWVRSKLKIKNLGPKAISLFEKEIDFFMRFGSYNFTTIRNYCEVNGLI
jgi:peptidoglycan/xylan/chitin deacetylase (PgdA/CDA1 family)